MIWLWIIISVFFSLITIAGTILFFIFTWKSGPREILEPNLPEVTSYLPQFTDGYTKGLEISCMFLKNGDYKCVFYPTDQEQKIHSENKSPGIKTLIVGRGYRITILKGENSSRRDQIIYNTKNPQDLPKTLLNTSIGKILTENSIVNRVMNDVNNGILESIKATTYIMKNYGITPLTREALEKLEELRKEEDLLKGIEKKDSSKKEEKAIPKPI